MPVIKFVITSKFAAARPKLKKAVWNCLDFKSKSKCLILDQEYLIHIYYLKCLWLSVVGGVTLVFVIHSRLIHSLLKITNLYFPANVLVFLQPLQQMLKEPATLPQNAQVDLGQQMEIVHQALVSVVLLSLPPVDQLLQTTALTFKIHPIHQPTAQLEVVPTP